MKFRLSIAQLYLLIVLMLLCFTSLWSYVAFLDMERESERIVANAIPISEAADDIMPQLLNMETGVRGYLITGEERYLAPYFNGQKSLEVALKEIEKHQKDHPIMRDLIQFEALPLIRDMEVYFESQIELVRNGNIVEARLRINDGKRSLDAFRKVDVKIEEDVEKIINDAWVRSNAAGQRAKIVIIVVGITALLVGLAFAYSFRWQRNHDELTYVSRMDGLTDLANRRLFDESLEHEWNKAKEAGHALSLLMIDVDSFKLYNDTYGHVQGDECLQEIARILKSVAQEPMCAARYGGEEFALIIPYMENISAMDVAERIREEVADLQMEHRAVQKCPYVTISVGVGTLNPAEHENENEVGLVQIADEALYRAKTSGKNQVCM